MKTKEIENANVTILRKVAKENKIDVPSQAGKSELVKAVTLHFHPKGEAVENSRASKRKDIPHRKRTAKVYDTFRVLISDDAAPDKDGRVTVDSVEGVTATFWKARPDAADFGGVTLRFDDNAKPAGADRAIIHNVRKACRDAGLVVNPVVIRKAGSGALYF